MALLTDGLVSEIADLTAYESDLPKVVAAEGIDLTVKIRLAQEEVHAQLDASARRPGNVFFAKGAGWQSSGSEVSLPRFDLSQVVVTRPLKLWHTFQTLELVYRDAHTRKLNDKYLPKMREYQELSKWAQEMLFQSGVGLVGKPVPRPKEPTLSFADSTATAMSVFVRVTWVGADGSEGAGSPERAVKTPTGKTVKVKPAAAPSGVSGWNVYAGRVKGEALLQNSSPLSLDASWVMPPGGVIDGEALGDGQEPDVYRTAPKFLQRG